MSEHKSSKKATSNGSAANRRSKRQIQKQNARPAPSVSKTVDSRQPVALIGKRTQREAPQLDLNGAAPGEDFLSQDEDSHDFQAHGVKASAKGGNQKRRFSEDSNYFSDEGEQVLRNLVLFISRARTAPQKKAGSKLKKKTLCKSSGKTGANQYTK